MENVKDNSLPNFQLIDLTYMKQISRGDLVYEREVTKLFISTIPENLLALKEKLETKSYADLNKVLHHMQSSIAIMGLDKKLAKFLDTDFYEKSNASNVKAAIDFITSICNKAILEAKKYLDGLK